MKENLEHEALESLVASDLSQKMKQWGSEKPAGSNRNKFSPWWLLLVVAAGLGWWYFRSDKPPAVPAPVQPPTPPAQTMEAPAPTNALPTVPEPPMAQKEAAEKNARYLALLESRYQPPPLLSDIRGHDHSGDVMDVAKHAFAEGHYQEALEAAEMAPTAYASDADFIQAHALMKLKRYKQASFLFQKLKISVRYGEAADWYYTLALLADYGANQVQLLRELRNMANNPEHTYQGEAAALLGEVR